MASQSRCPEAIALREYRAIALHHDHHGARAFALADPLRHQRVDHAGEIGSVSSSGACGTGESATAPNATMPKTREKARRKKRAA